MAKTVAENGDIGEWWRSACSQGFLWDASVFYPLLFLPLQFDKYLLDCHKLTIKKCHRLLIPLKSERAQLGERGMASFSVPHHSGILKLDLLWYSFIACPMCLSISTMELVKPLPIMLDKAPVSPLEQGRWCTQRNAIPWH
jgi:hypothetical protein